jgi:hypothetical protein
LNYNWVPKDSLQPSSTTWKTRTKFLKMGPYFYNSAGLYLRFWTEKFNPEKEDFTCALVWIRLYSFPQEFWLGEVLEGIGNTLGIFVKSVEATKQSRYTSYACICVYMDVSKPLPRSIKLEYQDEEWEQTIDYEHIPFRCHKFHEHGHLFRDCPLNAPSNPNPPHRKNPKMASHRCKDTDVKHRKNPNLQTPQNPLLATLLKSSTLSQMKFPPTVHSHCLQ